MTEIEPIAENAEVLSAATPEEPAEEALLADSPAAPPKQKKHWTNQEEVMGWIFSCIPLLGFLVFGLIPLALSLYISFNHFDGLSIVDQVDPLFPQLSHYVTPMGFGNFKMVLSDPQFWKAVLNTLFVVFTTLFSLALSVFISMMLYHCKRGKKFFQTVFFIPYVCSLVAITFMWQWIFDKDYGILNSLISQLGGQKISWTSQSPDLFRFVMFIVLVWSGTGFNIILLSAAMTNINKSCYEAAEIDGAGMFTKFFKITLPAISPTIFYLLVTGIIGSLQEFTRFQIMVPDGMDAIKGANITIVYYLYNKMRTSSPVLTNVTGIGVASAVGWILALLIGLVTFCNFKISKKWVSYDE